MAARRSARSRGVSRRSTCDKSAPRRSACCRFASPRSDLPKSTPLKSAPCRFAHQKFACARSAGQSGQRKPVRSAPRRSPRIKSAPASGASLKSAHLKSASWISEPARSRPRRSGVWTGGQGSIAGARSTGITASSTYCADSVDWPDPTGVPGDSGKVAKSARLNDDWWPPVVACAPSGTLIACAV